MASTNKQYFNHIYREKKDLFDVADDIDITSSQLDLPSKLTQLFKRGIGKRYVSKPKKLDAPMQKKHEEYLKSQFAKATYDHYIRATTLEIDRRKSFEDYSVMDYTPEISSALDIYADESLTKDEYGSILQVECESTRIEKVIKNLFDDVLDIEHNLWQWARNMCKYGNYFLLLDVKEEKGVQGFLPLPTEEIRREEAYDGNVNAVKFIWDSQNLIFDQWQLAHFRLLSSTEKYPYGTSSLESARLVWKQLQLAEDAMLIYRITRAPERRVFYIDVGNIDPADVPTYMADIKNTIKRTPQVNESTGNIDFKYNSMAVDEDFFIPRRGDKNSEIDTLPGASNLDDIGDIEYIQSKMFASLKIPKAYLTFDEQINAKATLSSEDFRFARTINRIQQALLTTLTQIAIIHLYALGFRDKDQLLSFKLSLTNPSTQTELEKIEIWSQKAGVFTSLWNEQTLSPVSYVWAMKNVFDFTDEEIEMILKQQFLEGKMKLEIEKASGSDPESMVGGMPGEESPYVDEEGNPLPPQAPEGQAYVDSETNLPVESVLKGILNLLKESATEKDKDAKKGRIYCSSKNLVFNSMSNEDSFRMLAELDENIGKPFKMLNENKIKG